MRPETHWKFSARRRLPASHDRSPPHGPVRPGQCRENARRNPAAPPPDATTTGHRRPAGGAVIRPFIIPVFLPHAGCPHRCVFCDQTDVTGHRPSVCTPETLERTVTQFLGYKGANRYPVQVSFYGGNFLGLDEATLHRLLGTAEKFVRSGRIDGIRFSTRPDTVTLQRLGLLAAYPVSTVELGVQSMNDRILDRSERGHTAADTERAVGLLKQSGYEIGLQMMVGLPGESDADAMASAEAVSRLHPDFVRIYPTVVLRHSLLARWYERGEYTPMALDRCVTLVKRLALLFAANGITVARMGLQPSADLALGAAIVAGPFHPAFGHLVLSEIFLDRTLSLLAAEAHLPATVSVGVHPRSVSRFRGLKNRNVNTLCRRFALDGLRIVEDPELPEDGLRLVEPVPQKNILPQSRGGAGNGRP